ncbi:hypothetical protein BCR33DRAFT_741063 [Rhizoclosmatium globosum]|uniref:Uncharacterized protein n=1 Tax=Rhizoclosmatium globosum TaxID=329046 RepID=A0A1Y2BXK7_9FUNG|nr:hypothetical protein BCR33DRAFT_741063 [Rhizoclosmatium globosum]|eukprot:ORY39387.1 hypothetical protein BCR33DRAFT_741063 [Rhizoclosmatium globosum]
MSLPTRSNLQGSVTSANSNVSGGILPNPYAQEALELQSTMLVLQQQLQTSFTNLQLQMNIGITRINKLVEMSTKVGAMTPDMISQNSSGSVSGDHDSDRPKSHLHRIPERPTVMLTGRKVDIETPADSMRSSMAVLSGGQAAASTFILSSAITSPQSGTSFIVLPSQQQQHDRYQYHDLKQHATAEPTTVTALPIVQMSANALPLLQINKAAGNNKLKRDPTTKSQVSAISATSQKSNTASMPPSSPSLGVKWDDKDYIRAASQESRKMVSNYDDIKRAKSTSYQPETLDTPQPALSNIRRKTDATIGTDSSLTTNSSVSPSATRVKDPEPVPRNTVSASNLPEVYSKTVTTIGRPKNAPFAGSRRTSIAGSLLQAQEDDGRQSRSPLFNIIHPVDTGDSSEFGTTHSVDMKTDNPEEHLKTQQQQQNQWEREPSWKNVERGTPGKSIFEQAEIGSRVMTGILEAVKGNPSKVWPSPA